MGNTCFMAAFLTWSVRRWLAAAAAAGATYLFFGLSTAVVANPVFGREVPPTTWSPGVLALTSILTGLLWATYVDNRGPAPIRLAPARIGQDPPQGVRTARAGVLGSLLAYLAIGCPVCNKVALVLLGTGGALQVYAPIQPYLGAVGVGLLAVALIVRLRGEASCATVAQWHSGQERRRGTSQQTGSLTTQDIVAAIADAGPPQRDGAARADRPNDRH